MRSNIGFNSVKGIIITTNYLNRRGFNVINGQAPKRKLRYKCFRFRAMADDLYLDKFQENDDNFILDAF